MSLLLGGWVEDSTIGYTLDKIVDDDLFKMRETCVTLAVLKSKQMGYPIEKTSRNNNMSRRVTSWITDTRRKNKKRKIAFIKHYMSTIIDLTCSKINT